MTNKITSCDLHVHTAVSGGELLPEQLVRYAAKKNIGCIAITDMHSVAGLDEALVVAGSYGVRVVPGVEIIAVEKGHAVFFLGYFINPDDAQFQADIHHFHIRDRALTPAEAIELINAAEGVAVLANPLRSLNGHSNCEALMKFKISQYQEWGLSGVEVYRPEHSPEAINQLEGISTALNLVATGGSDFHSSADMGHQLGQVQMPPQVFDNLLQTALKTQP
jgi:predicted metal-dependent phosphoesterase TrpH